MQEDLTVTCTGLDFLKIRFKTIVSSFYRKAEKRVFKPNYVELLLSRQLGKSLLGSGGQELGNELSAPYEVPQFPIEQIESKIRR